MKILHVIPHYFPSPYFGGTPVVCHNIAKEQVKIGHQADILTTDVYSKDKRIDSNGLFEESKWGYKIIRKRNISNWIAFRFKQSLSLEALKFIKNVKNNYDVIHLHEYRSLLNVMVAFADTGNSKIILHPQGTFENFNGRTLAKKIFDKLFSEKILKRANQIIAISEKEKSQLTEAGVKSEKINIMYNGVDVEPGEDKNINVTLPKKYILYLGRINKIKNLDVLVDAFLVSNVWKEEVKLIIAGGDDGYLEELQAKIKNQASVEYVGPVGQAQKNQLIKNSLFVAYITRNEPWGLVPLEAAVLDVPSLVSTDAGIASTIEKYKIGRLVDVNLKGKIVESIKSMINEPIKISKKISQQLKDDLSWSKYTQKLMNIYSL